MSRSILHDQVNSILQNTVYDYRMNLVNLPRSLNDQKPTLSVLMHMEKASQGTISSKLKEDLRGQQVTMALEDMKIPKEDIPALNRLLAKLLKVIPGGKLDLQEISTTFNAELRKKNIGLRYYLSLQQPLAPVFTKVEISGKRYLISAVPEKETTYLLLKSARPILIAVILVLLTGGCLIYMAIIMKQQLRLDELKNNFITNLTHEFRTPIAALLSTHEALVDFGQLNDPNKALQYLAMNRQILKKLDQHVDHLLETSRLSRQAALPPSEMRQLSDLIHETSHKFFEEGRNNVQTDIHLSVGRIMVNGYAFDTILSNLVDNAIKYTTDKAQIMITAQPAGKFWELIVSDNGIGIPAEFHPYLFDRFFRVPQGDRHDVKGYGLGLSYVHELVRLLDAKIKVYSSPGKGTSFIIQFLHP